MNDIIYEFGWTNLILTNAFTLTISSFLFFMSIKIWHKSFKKAGLLLPIDGNGDLFDSKFLDSLYVLFMFLISSVLFLLNTIHLIGILYSIIGSDSEIAGRIISIEERGGTEIIDMSGFVFENKLNVRSRTWCFDDSFKTLNVNKYYKMTIVKSIFSKTTGPKVVCILKIKTI